MVRVDAMPALEEALQQGGFDVILSNFVFSAFDRLHVLALVQHVCQGSIHCRVRDAQRYCVQSDADMRSNGLCAEASPLGFAAVHSARRWAFTHAPACLMSS